MDDSAACADYKDYKHYLEMRNSQEYQLLQQFYHKKTIFDILGVARQENPHSNFISWILDPYESHGMGDFPFKRFVETMCFSYLHHGIGYLNEKNCTFRGYPQELQEAAGRHLLFFNDTAQDSERAQLMENLMRGDYRISSCEVAREKVLEKQRRADIYIKAIIKTTNTEGEETDSCRLLIFIENKVTSSENDKQTNAYMKFMLEKSVKEFQFILPIYLYPASNPELYEAASAMEDGQSAKQAPCSNRLFLLMNYQFLMDGVLAPCQRAFRNEKIYDILTEYISCLGKSINDNGDGGEQAVAVMAVGEDEKKWSMGLWTDYQTVLESTAKELAGKSDTKVIVRNEADAQFYRTVLASVLSQTEDAETIEFLKDAVTIQKRASYFVRQTDGTIWEFTSGGRGKRTLGALAYVLVRQYMINHPNESMAELKGKLKKEINHNWLFDILVTKDQLRKMLTDWLDAYSRGGKQTPVCPRNYVPEQNRLNAETGMWDGCVVSTSRCNNIRNSTDCGCPLSTRTNQELYKWYTGTEHPCSCVYDFLYAFFVGGIKGKVDEQGWEKNGIRASQIFDVEPVLDKGVNTSFGALEWGYDFAYLGRWWSVPTLEKLIDALCMRKYVSAEPAKIPVKLDFMI